MIIVSCPIPISLVDDPATLGRLNEALEAVLNKAQV